MKQADVDALRRVAEDYARISSDPIQDRRRNLWSAHHGLHSADIPIIVNIGWHNTWVKEHFGPLLECADQLLRSVELALRLQVFKFGVGDDSVQEPWVTAPCVFEVPYGIFGEAYGVSRTITGTHDDGGSWKADGPIKSWEDVRQLKAPGHRIDEARSKENADILEEVIGDIIEIDTGRRPGFHGFGSDISTTVAGLRGLEEVMVDMYESPRELHELLAFMRDSILEEHDQAESAGSFSLTTQVNQSVPYADDLEAPKANAAPKMRKDLWGFCAAQEMTLISPEFHDEFIFQYQKPIYERFGLVHYGCCEDLSRKIDMLRALPNLRSIAIAPSADVRACAEQIGTDYSISYRPNPTDMVCADWSEDRIRTTVGRDLGFLKGQHVHISLKDIETVQGDPSRLRKWVEVVRSVIE